MAHFYLPWAAAELGWQRGNHYITCLGGTLPRLLLHCRCQRQGGCVSP